MDLASIEHLVAAHGLHPRGGFYPTDEDGIPALADGRMPATLLLIGNVGSSLWPEFSGSTEAGDGAPDPLTGQARWFLPHTVQRKRPLWVAIRLEPAHEAPGQFRRQR